MTCTARKRSGQRLSSARSSRGAGCIPTHPVAGSWVAPILPLAGEGILCDIATAGRVVDEAEAERRTTPTLLDPAPTRLGITGSTARTSSSPSRRWIRLAATPPHP
ncbi:hypothetical protein DAI22_12g110000 [Oryza sativa Japonica Group]|nr:hypothetical protein DAI22_12g110000 [Oryza sativa Japonica Group]